MPVKQHLEILAQVEGRPLQRSRAAAPEALCHSARGPATGIIFGVTLTDPPPHQSVIRAAGGILQRTTPDGEEVMLVYRRRYSDWSLPKGKLNTGESFPEAALREVQEETGCVARLGEYAGEVTYDIVGAVKLVRFWRMSLVEQHPIEEQEEVAEARWLRIPDAIQKLTYSSERDLLARLSPVHAARHS
jgi:8-oxo-dGTP pyrophosphatase MutT (NUDIX family)